MGHSAKRRHDLKRMKLRCLKVYPYDQHAKLANHMQSCSCHGCGSQRKYEGLTLQERRFMASN